VEEQHRLYGFLTTDANNLMKTIRPKAMPVILTKPDEWQAWLYAPWNEASALQRPVGDEVLRIVAQGEKLDG
jgi:putative SOS response-associated peptidase YedK